MSSMFLRDERCAWILDTHLHLHPQFTLGEVLRACGTRLAGFRASAPAAVFGGIVAEMEGGYSWSQLSAGAVPGVENLRLVRVEEGALSFRVNEVTIYLFRGKQVVSREGVEVLALLPTADVPSGEELGATIDAIVALRGVPVLPWSPGKWWGKRGRLVREVVARDSRVWVGDISLRFWGARWPLRLRGASGEVARVLYGSDPLPVAGGGEVAGQLLTGVSSGEVAAEEASIVERLRVALSAATTQSRGLGWYQEPSGAVRRWVRVMVRRISGALLSFDELSKKGA